MNASRAHLTIAFAIDFESPGERLTRKVAGRRYQPVSLDQPASTAAVMVYHSIKNHNASVINIAGHSLPTLEKFGWNQEKINSYLYEIFKSVLSEIQIDQIISGGQTGVDIAGVVVAEALGIDAVATLPRGYLQRVGTRDVYSDPDSIYGQVKAWSQSLLEFDKDTSQLSISSS